MEWSPGRCRTARTAARRPPVLAGWHQCRATLPTRLRRLPGRAGQPGRLLSSGMGRRRRGPARQSQRHRGQAGQRQQPNPAGQPQRHPGRAAQRQRLRLGWAAPSRRAADRIACPRPGRGGADCPPRRVARHLAEVARHLAEVGQHRGGTARSRGGAMRCPQLPSRWSLVRQHPWVPSPLAVRLTRGGRAARPRVVLVPGHVSRDSHRSCRPSGSARSARSRLSRDRLFAGRLFGGRFPRGHLLPGPRCPGGLSPGRPWANLPGPARSWRLPAVRSG
jgi:hypothetical protein